MTQENITDSPVVAIQQTEVRGSNRFRQAFSAGLLMATTALSACSYETEDHTSSDEAMALLNKENPCSFDYDYKRKSCEKQEEHPTMALVVPQDSGIDTDTYADSLIEAARLMSGGKTRLSISVFEASKEVSETMTDSECTEDSDKDEAGDIPAAQAAIQDSRINEHDFVMAVMPDSSCDPLVAAATFTVMGDRLINVYNVESDDEEYDDMVADNKTNMIHEIGHAIFDLGHAGTPYTGSLFDGSFNNLTQSTRVIDFEAAVRLVSVPDEYGDGQSIMGAKSVPEDINEGTDLLTPMELSDANAANGRVDSKYIGDGYNRATIKNNKWSYVNVDYDKDHKLSYSDGTSMEAKFFGLMFRPLQSKYGVNQLDVYTNLISSEYEMMYFKVGTIGMSDSGVTELVLSDISGQRILEIALRDNQYQFTLKNN